MARKTVRSIDRTSGLNVPGPRADVTALSLLSAAGFTLNLQKGDLTWNDDHLVESLLKFPSKRIPRSQSALEDTLSDDDKVRRAELITGLSYDQAVYELRYQLSTFDGDTRWIQERGRRMSGDGSTPHVIMGVISDISDLKREEMAAAFAASHDPLTRLWNRNRFSEALNYERSAAGLREEPGFAAYINVENLAQINAKHGRAAGDDILKRIADYLKMSATDPLSAARIAGTGFGLLCPGFREPDARLFLKNICDWISGQNFGALDAGAVLVSMQSLNASEADAETLLGILTAQAVATEVFFTPSKAVPSAVQISEGITADDILTALNDHRFALAYQPIIHAGSRVPHHYECLLRLAGPDGSLESAYSMITAAESLGYIHLLDRRALNIGAQLLADDADLELAFNVSAGTIRNRFAAESYLGALGALGEDARRVSIELTETLALQDPDEAGKFAHKARDLGCRFAIDDFGSGHTTFQNLMTIEADMIKIDGSMIKNLADMPLKETFVRIMVDFAQTFGVEIVAEMVNSEADADRMEALGVDYFQGYMFGKPAPEPLKHRRINSEQSRALQ